MAIVLALFAFGIIFVGNSGSTGGSISDQTVVSIEGIGITNKEVSKKGIPASAFFLSRAPVSNPLFFQEIASLTEGVTLPGVNGNEQFALISLLAKVEAQKLGIFVTQDDAEQFILKTLFNDGDGNTHMSQYKEFLNFIDQNMGLKESEFRSLIGDYLTIQKVAQVKNGVTVPFHVLLKANDIRGQQTIDSDIVQFDISTFKGSAEPTEDEIKAFFEAEKNGAKYGRSHFYTERKVKLSYIPVNLKAIPAESKDNLADVEIAKIEQERDYKNYRKFINDDTNVGDVDAKALAEKYNLQFITTDFVTKDELNEFFDNFELLGEFRNRGTLYNYLLNPTILKSNKLEVKVPQTHKASFVHYYIEDQQEPVIKTYEQAKETAKKLLIKELEVENMTAAANTARETLLTAQKENKDLKKEVKILGGKVFSEAKFSLQTDTLGLQHISSLFQQGAVLSPNSVSEVVTDDNSAAFITVYKREVEKLQGYKELEKLSIPQRDDFPFAEWLIQQFEQTEEKTYTSTTE